MHVDLSRVDIPVLQLTAKNDHLFPPETSTPFNDVITSEDTTVIECPTGHVGLSVSGRSHETVRLRVCAWFEKRS